MKTTKKNELDQIRTSKWQKEKRDRDENESQRAHEYIG